MQCWYPAQHNQPDSASEMAVTRRRVAGGRAREAQGRCWLDGPQVLGTRPEGRGRRSDNSKKNDDDSLVISYIRYWATCSV